MHTKVLMFKFFFPANIYETFSPDEVGAEKKQVKLAPFGGEKTLVATGKFQNALKSSIVEFLSLLPEIKSLQNS